MGPMILSLTPYLPRSPNAVDLTPWPKNKALPEWKADLGNPDANKIGFLNAAAFIVKSICMGPVNSWVVDRFGRKVPIQWFSFD
ncbi:hypothetical protein IAR50_000640 [Cryptococcus sp. DSM 104548]